MANTFKVKTNAAMPASAGTPLTLYTVPSSTTTVVLGLMLCNVHTSQVTADVQLVSDTSDTETNETVCWSRTFRSRRVRRSNCWPVTRLCLQTTDVLKIDCSVAAKIDATLSIMEIT